MNKIAGTSAALAGLLVKPFKSERKLVGIEPKIEKIEEKVQKPDVQVRKDSADKVKKDTVKDGPKKDEKGSELSKILAKQRNRKR